MRSHSKVLGVKELSIQLGGGQSWAHDTLSDKKMPLIPGDPHFGEKQLTCLDDTSAHRHLSSPVQASESGLLENSARVSKSGLLMSLCNVLT